MELTHVTSILLVAMAMTIAVSCALPYPSWFDPQTAALDTDEGIQTPSQFGPDLDRIRLFMALKLLRKELSSGDVDTTDEENEDTSRAKRLDFGLVGLDTMDVMTNALDNRHRSSNRRTLVDWDMVRKLEKSG